ncbi:TatD family hydrolase [Magnetofaba australis]|uniref:Putative TatD family hydrolase n=1 Tax=Magnetofaba australis IT-1 TaxID=1434232 RepID=A0A1Y2K7A2_9PROT|nr:TatD family hydrolase [Magnetofaba australis]OSM05238.1 putative TatD family hydrolase [Magnetofaba australis IT-1]
MLLADSHAHLTFDAFSADIEAVFARAEERGVRYINLIATSLAETDALLALAEGRSGVTATTGVHPHKAGLEPITVDQIRQRCQDPRVIAIGETGLDYFYDKAPREAQQESFRLHIRAAVAEGMPLVVHTRDAEEDTRKILEEEGADRCGGVIHCFTGSEEMARWALDFGFSLSFSGIISFRNAANLREIVAWAPLDRILIETDSPYLAPTPHRGGRNEPAYVARVAEVIAQARDMDVEEVALATTRNYLRLFRITDGYGAQQAVSDKGLLAYPIGDKLYLNITQGCTLKCAFCPKWSSPQVHDYDLTLKSAPSEEEVVRAMGDLTAYSEVVFCGYGEPTLRLGVMLALAKRIQEMGKRVRLNTDGLANRVYGEDVTPRFAGLIDSVSISLNAQEQAVYDRHCQPAFEDSYAAVKQFISAVKRHVPHVTATAIDGLDGVDIAACQRIAQDELGVAFRARDLDRVG